MYFEINTHLPCSWNIMKMKRRWRRRKKKQKGVRVWDEQKQTQLH
jgi:hypothetical protein